MDNGAPKGSGSTQAVDVKSAAGAHASPDAAADELHRHTQRPSWLTPYLTVGRAIAELLHPHVEVVIHDIGSDRIVAIWNAVSGRRVGDPSLLGDLPEFADDAVDGPYAKVLLDGRQVTSVTAPLLDQEGVRRGLLCVNLELSPLDEAIELLATFARPRTSRPPELFSRDWREQIALEIDEECRSRHLRRDSLTRADRLMLVKLLEDRGLFATRNAADHAARALRVSRTSVYNLLREARSAELISRSGS